MAIDVFTPARPLGTPHSEEVVVSVSGLTKVFKDFWGRPKALAVDRVDFEVRRGEVFGLLGPNGSGKSTTVKLILGLLNPTRGHILVFGHSPRHVATKARIGYLPEESYLYRYLDSRETLDFFGNLFELAKDKRADRTEQLLEMVGLRQVQRRAVSSPRACSAASAWPRRSSTTPTWSSWTSRPPVLTPSVAARSRT